MKKIDLSWRRAGNLSSYVVGELIEPDDKHYLFRYVSGKDLEAAKALGFSGYPAFPDLTKEYSWNVIECFAIRLPSRSREDFKKLLEHWGSSDPDVSDFDLLAITGGCLMTDHFKFIIPNRN